MVRTKDSVKVRDLDTNNPVGHYKGFLVFKQKDEKYVGVDSNDFEVKGNNLDDLKRKIDRYIPIQNKDSKTKDGEEQTIGNYEGYRLVFKNGFVRALEDGFTKFEVLSSMGNGGWTQADVKKLMNKIDWYTTRTVGE